MAAPVITGITNSKGDLTNPDTTSDPILTLMGTGTASTVVLIKNNGTTTATSSVAGGEWIAENIKAVDGANRFMAGTIAGETSDPWLITVGSAELVLPPPAIAKAPNGVLDPINAVSGLAVTVAYVMDTTDTIGLSWNGDDTLVPTQSGSASGSVTFTVPAAAVAAAMGKTIAVVYAVVRDADAKLSETLDLTVKQLANSELPLPIILEAGSATLDVTSLTRDANLTVGMWPFIAKGQLMSLRFEGTKIDGSAYNWSHPLWQSFAVTTLTPQATTIALGNLKALKNGSNLSVIFEVSFDNGVTKTVFPSSAYRIAATHYPSTENFDSYGFTVIERGQELGLSSMIIRNKFVTALQITHLGFVWPPYIENMRLYTASHELGEVEVEPKGYCPRVRFYYQATQGVTVTLLSFSGTAIAVLPLWEGQHQSFDHVAAQPVARIVFRFTPGQSFATSQMDNFRFDAEG